jgi:hypothetical protein
LPPVRDLVQGTTTYLPHLKKTDINTLNRSTKSTNIMILPKILPRTQEERVNVTPPTPKSIKIKQVQSTLNPVSLNTKSNDKVDTTWGHSLDPIENLTTFRILYQNPNGINISNKAFQYKYSLSTCRSLNIAAITIVETKLNTNNHKVLASLKSAHSEVFHKSFFQTSQTPDKFIRDYQPGGTMTLLCENWSSKVISKGTDPYGLGRWSHVTL